MRLRLLLLGSLATILAVACGIGIRRDLSDLSPGRIGYDDLCGLQRYFDAIATGRGTAPRVVLSLDIGETRRHRPAGGRTLFAFETRFQRRHFLRLLRQNWQDLPEGLGRARRLRVEVTWADLAGIQRVARDEGIRLEVDRQKYSLPYHPCLSDLLFGEPLYAQRRRTLKLGPLPPRRLPDGGTAHGDWGF